ncbi:argonaute-like protein [Stereum hirsutum FP-91666 SS1]|uniref:argonaute-like protein n=1 Tax=Stereum hirsutum (strain FP-91666) TaxID=721885 RepID=UPI000440D2F8|nr:argonaute-like protein [Stereum hirsutum FP-91666 SS1]EIM88070.1 argonaute-like protein [Stereum hirsutum FP-91666 SS1]
MASPLSLRGRGRGRGVGGPVRGGAPLRGGPPTNGTSQIASHVEAIGVKRPGFGVQGKVIEVNTNHFACSIPEATIHHYDVISPSEKVLPAALNFEIIKTLQTVIAPNVFTPHGVYDGRKNMFSTSRFSFGATGEFAVCLATRTAQPPPSTGGKGPTVYKIRLTHVAEINPETLSRFLRGQQTHDNDVLTAITALNVAVRMEPNLTYPFNIRSFYTPDETRDIGGGIILWRGYFQSVRPSIGRMLINVDISTGAFYAAGSFLALCVESYKQDGRPNDLSPRHNQQFTDRNRLQLQRFVTGIKITTKYGKPGGPSRMVRKLSRDGANDMKFMSSDGEMTVAAYFKKLLNRPLQYPDVVCAELSSGALIPLELCDVPPGQIIKKQIPASKTKSVLEFATQRPQQRLQSISNGLGVLAYGQSEYVRQFGMTVTPQIESIKARVLQPPRLKYGEKSKQPLITPNNGGWNMIDKKVYKPGVVVDRWVVVIYEREQRFNMQAVEDMIAGFTSACNALGVFMAKRPVDIRYCPALQVTEQVQALKASGAACFQKTKQHPQLIIVVLPEVGNDIYTAVKHFGDISAGVATQCMKSAKCFRANHQYYSNVILKLNAKLGGINTIPDPRSVVDLSDPNMPTIVMGVDAMHPAPGSDGRPSFTAVVGNIDSDTAKYVATIDVQASREEIVLSMQRMVKEILEKYMAYRKVVEKKANPAPKRIILYRDGVSEGQFKHVLDRELPLIKAACAELKINPKITIVVVGKRHHVRFFPKNPADGDKSGNCPAGLVVDQAVTNPVEFDFYLQSHGGLLGTSRPSHYNVLHDENNFTADGIQSLSFALCHVYARATRSVSIPAPVYYADIVCSRAKHHYDPQQGLDFSGGSDSLGDIDQQNSMVQQYRAAFKPLHANTGKVMYFC